MARASKTELFWLLLIIIAAVLTACEGDEEELGQSLDTSAKTSPTPIVFEGDPTCGLLGQPTVTPWHDQVDPWAAYAPEAIAATTMESDLVVSGRVSVSEQHYSVEAPNDRYQDVCLAVTDILRGDAARPGEYLLFRIPDAGYWDPPIPPPPPPLPAGGEYVVFLTLTAPRGRALPGIDWYSHAFRTYALSDPESDRDVQLVRLVREAPNFLPVIEEHVESAGLSFDRLAMATRAVLPTLPDAPGSFMTLYGYSVYGAETVQDPRRAMDAAASYGFNLEPYIGQTLWDLWAWVADRTDPSLKTQAQFLATDTELVGGWLRSQHDVWGLGEWQALRQVLQDEAAGVSHPSRNRAGDAVNLAEWYAMDSTLDVKIKTGNAAVTDATLSTPEMVAALIAALDRDLSTAPLEEEISPPGCSEIGMLLARTDGLASALTYNTLTNRLSADLDGFSVAAPEEISALLGVTPYAEGECYIPIKTQ